MPQIIINMDNIFYSVPNGATFVAKNGNVFKNESGKYIPLSGRKRLEMVKIKVGERKIAQPLWVPNQVFTDDKGVVYLLANEKNEHEIASKAAMVSLQGADTGYIIVRNNRAEAWVDGVEVDFPSHLINERGVRYMFVDFAEYGKICKRVNGYYDAKKVEPVLVLQANVGDRVESIVNGVREHDTILEEGMVLVQNKYHGETYKQKVEKLHKSYKFSHVNPDGTEEWVPKEEVNQWTWTKENIVGVLWESFEFLTSAMINITNDDDVYGCNYGVFNGTDTASGSHLKIALYLPITPLPKIWLEEAVLSGVASVLEAIPKTDYCQVSLPGELMAACVC